MKKQIAQIVLLFIPLLAGAQVQKGQSEISVSGGISPYQQIVENNLGTEDGQKTLPASIIPPVFINYRHYISQRIAIGIAAGKEKFNTGSWDPFETYYHTIAHKYTTVAAEGMYNYINRRWVRVYGYAGLGCNFYTDQFEHNAKQHYTELAFQVVPVGVSVGGKISCFAEAGIGYKGIANCGVSYRFSCHKK